MSSYWWKNAVIYEVYVDKFANNFKGMVEKLPYLRELGINCIWILPHYPSPMVDDGYDVSDYMDVRKELGTLSDFEDFVQEAHKIGIRVIIDLVLNHVSIQHPWFVEASQSVNSPKKDYFLWSKTGKEFEFASNPFSHMTKGNWTYNFSAKDYYYFTSFLPQQADLNWDNPKIFDEITGVMDFWIDKGVDGFRLDAASHLYKREGTDCKHLPEVHKILKRLRVHLDRKSEDIIMLAEAGGTFDKIIPYFGDGDECHMVFNFPLMASIYLVLKNDNKSILDETIGKSMVIPENCQWATFLRNHDELNLSFIGQEEQKELITWLDNNDKYSFKGGSGTSMRLATIFKGDKKQIIKAFELLLSLPGSPVIYYGDEIGMKNLELADVPIDSRKYVRGNFDWDEAKKQMKNSGSIFNGFWQLIGGRLV